MMSLSKKWTGKKASMLMLTLLAIAAVTFTAGCGGGGGGSASAPAAPKTGLGRVSAAVSFTAPEAARAAAQTTSTATVSVDIEIIGEYSETGEEFATVTAHIEVPMDGGTTQVQVLSVPVGRNHLLKAVATFPGGSQQTILAIIESVEESADTSVVADERSTVIANAAIALAERDGLDLSDITTEQLGAISSAIDDLVAAGYSYSQISTDSLLNYSTLSSTVATVELTPASATIVPGTTFQFETLAKNSFGVAIAADMTWSADAAIGTISSTGLLTAGATPGAGIVTVASGGISATAQVTVDYTIVSASLSPAISPYGEQNSQQQFTLSGVTPGGQTVDLTAFATWAPSAGLTAAGAPGLYTFTAMGAQSIAASYNGVSAAPLEFEVVEAAPGMPQYTASPALDQLTFDEDLTIDFTPVNGRAPYTYETLGAFPYTMNINPDTGQFTGMTPHFIGVWDFKVRATDALSRSTGDKDVDAPVSIKLSVKDKLTELSQILQVADGAMDQIQTIATRLQELAGAVSGGSLTQPEIDAAETEYQQKLTQISDVANSASFNGTLTTNGPILLNGSYYETPIEIGLTGYPSELVYTYFDNLTSDYLGIAGTSVADPSSALNALNNLGYSAFIIGMDRYINSEMMDITNTVSGIDDYLTTHSPSDSCLNWLHTSADVSDYMYGVVINKLLLIREKVAAADGNTDSVQMGVRVAGRMTAQGVISAMPTEYLQNQIYQIYEFLSTMQNATAFDDYLLLDGSFETNCLNSPTIYNPPTDPYSLGIDSIDLFSSSPYDATDDLALIDSIVSAITDYRATLASQKIEIENMISSGAPDEWGLEPGIGGGCGGECGCGGCRAIGKRPLAKLQAGRTASKRLPMAKPFFRK